MLQKYKDKKDQGFTIIEVLIVLAIAGLIILIVFLAVPALQRNSRNTQRKEGMSLVVSAFKECLRNHHNKISSNCDSETLMTSYITFDELKMFTGYTFPNPTLDEFNSVDGVCSDTKTDVVPVAVGHFRTYI